MSTPTDSDLLRNIAAGDEAALRQLYERHAGWLLLRLNRRCGNPAADPLGDEVISAATPLVHSAEDELLLGVEYGEVGWALRTLPPELRATVQATVIDGLTTKEAAKLLGLPQGTVKSRLRVAKVQLRERLMPARDGRI